MIYWMEADGFSICAPAGGGRQTFIRGKGDFMQQLKVIGMLLLGGLALLTVFHILHYVLFCRYRTTAGKSHCGVCRHRRVCRKHHRI